MFLLVKDQAILIENVPGLLSSNEGRDFEIILQGLVELGYVSRERNGRRAAVYPRLKGSAPNTR